VFQSVFDGWWRLARAKVEKDKLQRKSS